MSLIQKINQYVVKAETVLLVFIVLSMVLLAFAQVVLRNLFDQGILWADIFLRHLVLWVGFIGASLATREEKHINIDVLTRFTKGRPKAVIQTIVMLFAVYICYLLLTASWNFVMEEREYQTMLFENIPAWYFQIIIPIGFSLMGIRFLLSAIEKAIPVFARQEKSQ